MDDLKLHGLLGSGGNNIKSIQRITMDGWSESTLNKYVTIGSVNVDQSIVLINFNHSANANAGAISAYVFDSTNVRLDRKTTTPVTGNINLTIIEFNNVKSKQSGSYSLGGATEETVTVSPISVEKSILYTSVRSNGTNGNQFYFIVGNRIVDSTTIAFTSPGGANNSIQWQLIEFK